MTESPRAGHRARCRLKSPRQHLLNEAESLLGELRAELGSRPHHRPCATPNSDVHSIQMR